MKVLVTGGAGFIGSHTCVELAQAGYDVVIVDNFANAKEDMPDKITALAGKNIPCYHEDVRNREALEKIFAAEKVDAVIHFAGLKAVGESVSIPLQYYHDNLYSTIVLLETMKKFNVKKIVFSSSATVYGNNNPVPFREEYPTSATNPYGYTKVMIEQILFDLAHAEKDWSIVMLRYFNPIGAHESGLIGEDPNGIPNNLVPYVAKVAAGILEKVNVFGDDYDTPDGTGVRDYIHVVDLALGHLAALKYADGHQGAVAVNLGTGHGSSVLDVIHAYEKACGHPIPYSITPRRPGDIASCYASTDKAEQLFGWKAERTMEQMCADSWRFAKNHY